MGDLEGWDPQQLRISDEDRHKVAELLRAAAGEGRIDLDELEERLEATWAAKTYGDLVPITADLPTQHAAAAPHPAGTFPPAVPAGPAPNGSFAMLSGVTRKGVWTVGARHTAAAVMGGVDIDLRQAHFTARETTINAAAIMGGIDVVVNARTHVVVDGFGLMGSFEQARDRVAPVYDADSPVVRVTGFALMGAVTVTRKQMPGEPRPKRRMLPPH